MYELKEIRDALHQKDPAQQYALIVNYLQHIIRGPVENLASLEVIEYLIDNLLALAELPDLLDPKSLSSDQELAKLLQGVSTKVMVLTDPVSGEEIPYEKSKVLFQKLSKAFESTVAKQSKLQKIGQDIFDLAAKYNHEIVLQAFMKKQFIFYSLNAFEHAIDYDNATLLAYLMRSYAEKSDMTQRIMNKGEFFEILLTDVKQRVALYKAIEAGSNRLLNFLNRIPGGPTRLLVYTPSLKELYALICKDNPALLSELVIGPVNLEANPVPAVANSTSEMLAYLKQIIVNTQKSPYKNPVQCLQKLLTWQESYVREQFQLEKLKKESLLKKVNEEQQKLTVEFEETVARVNRRFNRSMGALLGAIAGGMIGFTLGTLFPLPFISNMIGALLGAFIGSICGVGIAYLLNSFANPLGMCAAIGGEGLGALIGGLLGHFFIPIPGMGLMIGMAMGIPIGALCCGILGSLFKKTQVKPFEQDEAPTAIFIQDENGGVDCIVLNAKSNEPQNVMHDDVVTYRHPVFTNNSLNLTGNKQGSLPALNNGQQELAQDRLSTNINGL